MKKLLYIVIASLIFVSTYKYIPVTYTINVKDFNHVETYTDKLHNFILTLADDNDTVIIKIDSYGGSSYRALKLVNLVSKSPAHIVTFNRNFALSAGGILGMVGDEIKANKYSTYMFHRAYYMSLTGEKKLVPMDSLFGIAIESIMKKNVYPYLTKEEKELYLKGDDIVIKGTDMLERIRRAK